MGLFCILLVIYIDNYRCDGCTSDSQNFTGWLKHYHATVVNANISRDKAGVSMLASTERVSIDKAVACDPLLPLLVIHGVF